MTNEIEQIKRRLNIIDVVQSYVPLKKSGRTYKACCPFHKEKSPSFTVSEERQLFYCFGCGAGGDLFRFVEKIENIEFPEALKILADRAGVTLEDKHSSSGLPKEARERLELINEKACQFFERELQKDSRALAYFANRGLTPELIKTFRLGYAPENFHTLHEQLEKEGFSKKELLASGIASAKDLGQEIFDRFRNRVIFPILSPQSKVIAFGGRALSDADQPKYLNSSDSPLYKKSHVLYNLDKARPAFRDQDFAILVEGYFDAISVYTAGNPNVVAPCGTALTEDQLAALSRFTKKLILCLDSDAAGQNATARAILLALPFEFELRIAQLPEGKDPDELIKKNPAAWQEVLKTTLSAWDFLLARALKTHDIHSATGKKQLVQSFIEFFQHLPSKVEFEHYLHELSARLGISQEAILQDLKRRLPKTKPQTAPTAQKSSQLNRSEVLLGFLVQHPEHIKEVQADILPDDFTKKACKYLQKQYAQSTIDEDPSASSELTETERQQLDLLALRSEEQNRLISLQIQEQEFKSALQLLYSQGLKAKLSALRHELLHTEDKARVSSEIETLKTQAQNLHLKL